MRFYECIHDGGSGVTKRYIVPPSIMEDAWVKNVYLSRVNAADPSTYWISGSHMTRILTMLHLNNLEVQEELLETVRSHANLPKCKVCGCLDSPDWCSCTRNGVKPPDKPGDDPCDKPPLVQIRLIVIIMDQLTMQCRVQLVNNSWKQLTRGKSEIVRDYKAL
jgi:hypothetical protein